jgi:hypothetical protein
MKKKAASPLLAKRPWPPAVIGWREYVSLPDFGIGPIIAKIDTGAMWCALHAENINQVGRHVHFQVRVDDRLFECKRIFRGRKSIRSSSGHSQSRVVIRAKIKIGASSFVTDITLTDRTDMGVPMLLGRNYLKRRFLVDPSHRFILSRQKKKPTA